MVDHTVLVVIYNHIKSKCLLVSLKIVILLQIKGLGSHLLIMNSKIKVFMIKTRDGIMIDPKKIELLMNLLKANDIINFMNKIK